MTLRLPSLLSAVLLTSAWLTAEATNPAKPYRLFVGVDLSVKTDDGTRRPVRTIEPSHIVLAEPERPTLSLREAPPFSWEHKTKVSRAPIAITDFQQHRTFTLRNDQKLQYLATQNNMAIYQQEKTDAARLAAAQARFTEQIARASYVAAERDKQSRAGLEGGPPEGYQAGGRDGLDFANVASNVPEAEAAMADQFLETQMSTNDPTFLDRAQGVDSAAGADVMELSFNVSSPDPIANAYVVIMGAIAQGEEEGVVAFHQPIGAIGPQPRKIKVRKTGFQPGFVIKEVKLHLYAYGKELATNLSERAVGMTREEAREFLLLSHIADHAVESLPPSPVWTLAPTALLAAKSAQDFDYPVVANIDADGSIISIHNSDTAARAYLADIHNAGDLRAKATPGQSLSASVRVSTDGQEITFNHADHLPERVIDALRDMVFLPALDVGTPVAATTRINLADFFH